MEKKRGGREEGDGEDGQKERWREEIEKAVDRSWKEKKDDFDLHARSLPPSFCFSQDFFKPLLFFFFYQKCKKRYATRKK